jgi:hypothetical protein
MSRRFMDSAKQAGYTAAEFGAPITANEFASDENRALWEEGWKAFQGRTFSEETAVAKRMLQLTRQSRRAGKGLKRARPVQDW